MTNLKFQVLDNSLESYRHTKRKKLFLSNKTEIAFLLIQVFFFLSPKYIQYFINNATKKRFQNIKIYFKPCVELH